MRRGEVRWCTLQPPDKRRPVVIMTRTSALSFLTSVTVAPVTTTLRDAPSQVLLTPDEDGVPADCTVNLDNLQTVEKNRIGAVVTVLSRVRMLEVDRALCFALGIDWVLE